MWPGYHMFFRKQVLTSGKWVNFGSDECTEISLVWNQLIIPLQAVMKHVVSKDSIFVQGTSSVFCQEWRNLWHCFRSCYITFKKKTSTCGSQVGHMWVTSGLFCGSSGSSGVTHFQPCSAMLRLSMHGGMVFKTEQMQRVSHPWNFIMKIGKFNKP